MICAAILVGKVVVSEPPMPLPEHSKLAVTAPEMLAVPPHDPAPSAPDWHAEPQTAEIRPAADLPPGRQLLSMPEWPVQQYYGFMRPGIIG